MKLENFSAAQFAGIKNKNITLKDGVNVIFGENESGKSTLINAISCTLTEPLNMDASHREVYFPTGSGNIISTKLELLHNEEKYTVNRTWSEDKKKNRLDIIKIDKNNNQVVIDEASFKEILSCPVSVYDLLVFGRQKNEQEILSWCNEFFSKGTKSASNKAAQAKINDAETTRNIVSQATSAAGGISSEKLCNKLEEELKTRSGNWDFGINAPKSRGKLQGRWEKGNGSIIKAFYNLEDAQNSEKELNEIEGCKSQLLKCREQKVRFKKEIQILEEKNRNKKSARQNRELYNNAKQKRDDAEYNDKQRNDAVDALKTVNDLIKWNTEFNNRTAKEQYKASYDGLCKQQTDLKKDIDALKEELANKENLADDCKTAKSLNAGITANNNKLNAGAVRAAFRMEPSYTATVEYSDGTSVECTDGSFDIDGYFRIRIPNVGEITITPKGIDADSLVSENKKSEEKISEILNTYSVETVDALETELDDYNTDFASLKSKTSELNTLNTNVDNAKALMDSITIDDTISITEDLNCRIAEHLKKYGKETLEACKSRHETIKSETEKKYGSSEDVKKTIEEQEKIMKEHPINENESEDEEDLDSKITKLQKEIDDCNKNSEDINRRLGELEGKTKGKTLASVREEIQNKKSLLEKEKKQYSFYRRILDDYTEILKNNTNNKYANFNKKFTDYLKFLSPSALDVEAGAGSEKLLIKSADNIVDTSLLSEGTSKTVLLAFRLAILDFYFPDGGGLIVLDDDLLDMDAARRGQSAKLLSEFAERNQVILMTCDENIANLMGGNRITVSR